MTKPTQGVAALAERMFANIPALHRWLTVGWKNTIADEAVRPAAAILGEHGLFVADVREHKPIARLDRSLVEGDIHDRHRKATLTCSCGWVQSFGRDGAEHWLDHLSVSK